MRSVFAKIRDFLDEHGSRLVVFLILLMQAVFVVAIYYFVTHVKEIKVKVPNDTHWWIPWIPVIGAVIVTAGALITLYTNKRLSERHFDRGALESLFTDILNRFASENAIIRANAAIRLGEMVRKKWPGKPNKKTPDNYPFFSDATSQLAAALHMENNQAVRDEILKALARITEFAKQDDQALLHLLIREMSDANRNAKAAFVEALAGGCSRVLKATAEDQGHQFITAELLEPLISFAPFCDLKDHSWACLFSLASSQECRAAAIAKAIRRKTQTEEERREDDLRFVPEIESCADRLMATRDALATALCALATPRDLLPHAIRRSKWERAVPFSLEDSFLAGAKLTNAQLQGARLLRAYLQGANLARAQLQRASLFAAACQGADLIDAQAQGADFISARLQRASLVKAQMQGADLSLANLIEAKLSGADFTGAEFEGTKLFGATVKEITIGSFDATDARFGAIVATYRPDLIKAEVGPAQFTKTNWWKSEFGSPLSNMNWWEEDLLTYHLSPKIDEDLYKWFAKHFPKPSDEIALSGKPTLS